MGTFLKHKIFFAFISLFAMTAGTGCSGGVGQGEDARAQQAKDSKALEDLYGGVQGRWEGVVSNPTIGLEPFKAEFSLYTYYVQDGANPDGSVRVRPALRGKFRPIDFVTETDVMTLTGDYDRNGQLRMTAEMNRAATSAAGSAGAAGSSADSLILSLRGLAAGNQMTLEVTRQGGVWGTFQGARVSTDASAPVAGEASEYRSRFFRINGHLEGRYFGKLKASEGADYNAEVDIVIIEQPLASGGSRPALRAQYKRLPAGELEWSLAVDYNSQTGEILMRDSSDTPTIGTMPGGQILSISGRFKTVSGKKVLDLEVRNKTSKVGTLLAERR